ncbi:TPA: hypothetical protein ACH3X2_011064 [Trebouxia sp. C0005]
MASHCITQPSSCPTATKPDFLHQAAMQMAALSLWDVLPTSTAVLWPTRTAPPITPSPVGVRVQSVTTLTQPISNNAAEALRQTDENLKKRIIALATKLENERDARMELDQRVSQALEVVSASRYQQSPLRRVSRVNAVQPFTRPTEDV